ncbi:phosphotransferase enzyme family protein [Candidatus Hodarchaeum mangrovi]
MVTITIFLADENEMEYEQSLNNSRVVYFQICELYGVSLEKLIPVKGGLVNLIYEFTQNGTSYIIRVSSHKSKQEIQSELEWILFLNMYGISVSIPVPSIQNNLIELLQYNRRTLPCVCFKKAIGKSLLKSPELMDKSLWNNDLWIKLGHLMGKMHICTTFYSPKDSIAYKQIDEDTIFDSDVFSEKPELKEKFFSIKKKILNLPRPKYAYGLVHNDINFWNFVLAEESLILFDFDDCGYNWYIHDITTTFHMISTYVLSSGEYSSFPKFLRAFWIGYRLEYSLDPYWISLIPLFLRFRLFHDYFVFNRMYQNKEFDPEDMDFFLQIIIDLEERIHSDRPFIDFPVEKWLEYADF